VKRKPLVALLVVKNKSILAEIRKSTDNFGVGAIWIPGGHIEEDEEPEKAMLREAKEEMAISPIKYYYLCKLPWEKDGKHYTIDYFVCVEWKGEIKNNEASELIWLDEKQIDKLDENVDRIAFKKYLEKINA